MLISEYLKKKIFGFQYSSETYIEYLKKSGAVIGRGVKIYDPRSVKIDTSRPCLLSIGNYVIICADTIILTHDYSHSVVRKAYGENVGDATPVSIGDNVFIGMKSIILMGAHISKNTIVGAGSVVTAGVYPQDVILAGNPAKVVCKLSEYYKRRKDKSVEKACNVVDLYQERIGRYPTIREMGDAYAWLYLPRTKEEILKYPEFFLLDGDDKNSVETSFLSSQSVFENYDSFLDVYEKWKKMKN